MPKFPKEQDNIQSNSFYSCDFSDCNREFNSRRNLVDHCRGHHEGKKPHLCAYPGCGKSFLRPAHLLIHNRIHTGEKPFICSYDGCGKRWNQKSALKQHMRSHTGEKPFECSFNDCNKKFSTSSSCKRHVSTHYATNAIITTIVSGNNEENLIRSPSSDKNGEYSNLSSPSMSPSFVQYWSAPFGMDSPSHSSSSSDEEVDTALLSNFITKSSTFKADASTVPTTKMNLGFLLN